VIRDTCPAKSRLTTAGSSTLITAIAVPMIMVPPQSQAGPAIERRPTPAASRTRAINRVRSIPQRTVTPCTTGEIAAKASSGTAASRPSPGADSPVSRPIRSSTGPTEVSAGRMPVATRTTPSTMISRARRDSLRVDA
jgi:hypothetical protein